MKTKLFVLFLITMSFILKAQSGFGESQLIDILGFQVSKVYSADLDGDEYMDVLISGQNANTVAWYKNLDGQGNFGEIQYIDQNLNFTQSLSTSDIDGDGDMDVLATSSGDDKVVWYKNLDGLGNFSTEIIIDNNAPNAKQALAADIDGDNDMDVVVAIKDESKVVWYENLDGLGNFSAEKIITNNAQGVNKINISDLDQDAYLDVIATSIVNQKILWFKNLDGLGNFGGEQIVSDTAWGVQQIVAADIDGDTDLDIVYGSTLSVVAWVENTDGQGSFTNEHIINTDVDQVTDVFVTDLDNDNYLDVLHTTVGDTKISWQKNTDGLGTFGDRKIIEDLASISIVAADIDGDGYKDILTSIDGLTNLVWYKNLTYLSVAENNINTIVLSPNPTSGIITINNLRATINTITVYDIFGKQILQQKNTNNTINLTNLQVGLYFIKIETLDGVLVKKVLKE